MLRTITLRNFKCFEEQTFQLGSLNLLTGLNGMGKSTLIQSLLLLRQNFDRKTLDTELSLNGDLVQCGNAKDILYQFNKNSTIGIELTFNNNPKLSWLWEGKSKGDSISLIKKNYFEKVDLFNAYTTHINETGEIEGFYESHHSPLFTNKFHYLNAERLGPRTYYETSTHTIVNKNQIGIRGEYAANYLAEFQDEPIKIPALKHPNSEGLSLYEQINAWISEIRPGTRVNVNSSSELGLVSLNFQFAAGKDAGNNFRPTNVGFGLSYILPLLVAVLASEPGTLLLLENPEAHLHPRGQAQMGRFLAIAAANGVQIIVESHSDHVLNGIRLAVKEGIIKPEEAKLMFFNGEVIDGVFTHHIETPQIDKNGKLDYRPEGFFDEWDKQLTQLI
jgi:predicted ATPase